MESFTTHSSGIQYGLVKDHGKCDLLKAKSRIANPVMSDHPYAVHVFRNVIEQRNELPPWTSAHISTFFDDALQLSLESMDDYRLYEKCKISVPIPHSSGKGKLKKNDAIGRQILQSLYDMDGFSDEAEAMRSIGVDRRSIVSFIEKFFVHATQVDSNFLYIYNSETPPQGIISCLNGISGHLDPASNSQIEEMAGINTSMFYIGSAGSFTELHVEDSIADSVNLLHAGKEKVWMIIDRADYARTNDIVAEKLKALQSEVRADVVIEKADICQVPLQHKNLVLTPRFLDEHKIRYEFVVQTPGDLLYVRYGILHQVVNVGVNVAEAINVGSDGWNFGNELKILCRCDACQLIHAATNTDVDMCVKVGKPKARSHRCETCDRIFRTNHLLVKHQKDDHSAKRTCEICDKQFQHTQSLNRHVRSTHSTREENEMRCSVCNKLVEDIVRHTRERHLQLVECSGCKTNFTRHDLVAHEKTCVKFTCLDCSGDFKSRKSLANHRRYCQKGQKPTIDKKRKAED